MILLAIDTATECCSAALLVDGKLFHRKSVQPRKHAELLLPFVDELLIETQIQKNQIQGLVVGQGPGAFTGVRIGVGIAQGIALALNIPVVAVSNLQTLAFHAYHKLNTKKSKKILVATDARMHEVYSAKYLVSSKKIELLNSENVGNAQDVDLTDIDAFIGSGFDVYPELIAYKNNYPMSFTTNVFSQAQDMLLMVKDEFEQLSQPIETIEPIYLREP